jgi:hypothetical protein
MTFHILFDDPYKAIYTGGDRVKGRISSPARETKQ